MQTKLQAQLHQLIIDQLTTTQPTNLQSPFKHIRLNGTLHNALTAHGAYTCTAWDNMGYPIIGRVDCIIEGNPHKWYDCPQEIDQLCGLAATLQMQAF